MNLHIGHLANQQTIEELLEAISQRVGNTTNLHADIYRRLKELRPDQWKWAKKIFTWVCYGGKKFSCPELTYLVGLHPSRPDIKHKNHLPMQSLTNYCFGLIVRHKNSNTVALAHNFTQQFFQDHRAEYFPEAYADIARVCMAHLRAASQSGHLLLDSAPDFMTHDSATHDSTTTISMHVASRLRIYLRGAEEEQSSRPASLVSEAPQASATSPSRPYSVHEDIQSLLNDECARLYTLRAINLSSQWDAENKRFHGTYSASRDKIDRSWTPLHTAAKMGLTTTAIAFANDESILNAVDSQCKTALMIAVENGHIDLAEQLAKHGASMDLTSLAGQDVFVMSVSKGNFGFVERMIHHAEQGQITNSERIIFAAYRGDLESFPLRAQCEHEKGLAVKNAMLSALLISVDRCHDDFLHRVVNILEMWYPSADKSRLRKALNHCDGTGRSALHRAARSKRPLVVQYLLDKGASVDVPSKEPESHTAWGEAIRLEDNEDVLGVLADYRANPNTRDREGVSALYQAAACGDMATVQRCLKWGTNPNIQTRFSWAPLVCRTIL
jgi:ankyrin repeat protein